MAYKGKRLAANGILQFSGDEKNLYIPVMKKSFHTTGLENCQLTYGNNISFIGVFSSEDTIDLKAVDDLPTEDNCNDIGMNFLSILSYDDVYFSALRTEMCGIHAEEGEVFIDCNIRGEKVSACLGSVEGVSQDEDSLYNWLTENQVITLIGKNSEVMLDKDAKTLTFIKAAYRFC